MSKKIDVLKEGIIEALEDKSEDEIKQEFSDLIREIMTEKQFWKYVASWKDGDNMCEEMEGWDIDTKREEIKNIKKNYLK